MQDITPTVLSWLLRYPLQRDSDLALALQIHPTTIYRHLMRLADEGLVESLSPRGENRQRLYYLTKAGLQRVAEQQAADPNQLARIWGANEAGMLDLLPRLFVLATIQKLINGLVAHAPTILAHPNGERAHLTWHWRRDWLYRFVSKGRAICSRADAALLFHRAAPQNAGQGEYYPLLILADGGLNGLRDRLILEQRLEYLLRYRESAERIAYFRDFPAIAILVAHQHQLERWQRAAQEVSTRLRLDPLCGAVACVPLSQQVESSWTLSWQRLESQGPCRLQDVLVPTSLDALPGGFFPPAGENTRSTMRNHRLIQGRYTERAIQAQKQGQARKAVVLTSLHLSERQRKLLNMIYAAPLLSTNEVAAFCEATPPTAARALYDLQVLEWIEQQDTECGRRWRLSRKGLHLMAAMLNVSVQHLAKGARNDLIQRDLPLLERTIHHTAGVYTFLAGLHQQAGHQGHQVAWWEIGSWCERRYHDHGSWRNLRPDAAFEYHAGSQRILAWLEWDQGTMTGGALAAKLRTYEHFLHSREWARELHALPLLLIVTPEPGQELRVRRIGAALAAMGLHIYTTTATRLIHKSPLSPIWLHLLEDRPKLEPERRSWVELRPG